MISRCKFCKNGFLILSSLFHIHKKPPQCFKPRNVIKNGFFVFLWIWPEPVRSSQREENAQKTSLKAKTNSPRFGRHHFYFKLVSSTPWSFCCFYVMYASFRSVTDKKKQNTNPHPDRKFFVDLNGPGILRDATLSDILVQQYYFLICLIAKLTHLKRKLCSFSDHAWDFRPFKKCFL